mmetsp:Transcript_21649/g.41310  ORF Transcript_21649/g.41310 Transcript_21649/m.41310 type:complete len:208 (+) Transcript_21649:502-1125(+)
MPISWTFWTPWMCGATLLPTLLKPASTSSDSETRRARSGATSVRPPSFHGSREWLGAWLPARAARLTWDGTSKQRILRCGSASAGEVRLPRAARTPWRPTPVPPPRPPRLLLLQRSLGWKRVTPHGPPRGQRATPPGRSTSSRWEWKRRSSTKNRKNKEAKAVRTLPSLGLPWSTLSRWGRWGRRAHPPRSRRTSGASSSRGCANRT